MLGLLEDDLLDRRIVGDGKETGFSHVGCDARVAGEKKRKRVATRVINDGTAQE